MIFEIMQSLKLIGIALAMVTAALVLWRPVVTEGSHRQAAMVVDYAQDEPEIDESGSRGDTDTLRLVASDPRLPEPGVLQTTIGYSQAGQPLIVHHLGGGTTSVLILGGQHGQPEANTVRLARQLLSHFQVNPGEIPASIRLDILTEANPDGLAAGSRQFLSGVDPNRNWGGPDWAADAFDSNGLFRHGLGGTEPFSEPETKALRDYVLATRPHLTINYHSRGGFLFGGRLERGAHLAAIYAAASGYGRPTPNAGRGSVLGYRATGSMNVWLAEQGMAGLLIELATSTDPEFTRNLAAMRAVLAAIADGP